MPRTNLFGHASASARPPFIIAVASRAQMLAMPVATLIWLVAARMMAEAAKASRARDSPTQMAPNPISSTSVTARRRSAVRKNAIEPNQTAARPSLGPCWLACVLLDEGQHLSPGIRRGVLVL